MFWRIFGAVSPFVQLAEIAIESDYKSADERQQEGYMHVSGALKAVNQDVLPPFMSSQQLDLPKIALEDLTVILGMIGVLLNNLNITLKLELLIVVRGYFM